VVTAQGRPPVGAAPAALDLHEGISAPPLAQGCERWPRLLRLASSVGHLVPGRCRATNLCTYCQRLYVIETVEMLSLDALEHAPTIWCVLTAREHLTRADTYRHLEKLRKAARKRWPRIEWFVQVEFQRRGALHLNLLIKGVSVEHEDELRDVLVSRWCARVDAEPVGQWVEPVQDAGGVVRYLSKMLAHGLKAEQAPPIGWKGHRTSHTRGYLVRPTWKMRTEARASLAMKRAIWRAECSGLQPSEAQLVAEAEVLRASQLEWECVVLSIDPETGELLRARPLSGGGVTKAMRSDSRAAARRAGLDALARAEAALAESRGRVLSRDVTADIPRTRPLPFQVSHRHLRE
jgi:hypothetical protein